MFTEPTPTIRKRQNFHPENKCKICGKDDVAYEAYVESEDGLGLVSVVEGCCDLSACWEQSKNNVLELINDILKRRSES